MLEFFTNNDVTFKVVLYVTDFVTSRHNIHSNVHSSISITVQILNDFSMSFVSKIFGLKSNCSWYSFLQYESNIQNISLKYSLINDYVIGVFQAGDLTKVEPTKVHLVSHTYIIQDFVSVGLYLTLRILYFYKNMLLLVKCRTHLKVMRFLDHN